MVDKISAWFDPLDYQDQCGMSPEEARKAALADRDKCARHWRKAGYQVRAWRLTDQLRKYRSFGIEDGRYRTVYYFEALPVVQQ